MDHGGGVSGVLVHVLADQVPEVDEQLGRLGNAVVRPGGEVEVTHRAALRCSHLGRDESVS